MRMRARGMAMAWPRSCWCRPPFNPSCCTRSGKERLQERQRERERERERERRGIENASESVLCLMALSAVLLPRGNGGHARACRYNGRRLRQGKHHAMFYLFCFWLVFPPLTPLSLPPCLSTSLPLCLFLSQTPSSLSALLQACRLTASARQGAASGEVANLMAVDAQVASHCTHTSFFLSLSFSLYLYLSLSFPPSLFLSLSFFLSFSFGRRFLVPRFLPCLSFSLFLPFGRRFLPVAASSLCGLTLVAALQ
jgi:hypothetical protein